MGFDERLFEWLAQRWRSRETAQTRAAAARAAVGDEHVERLRTLCGAVAGRPVDAAVVDDVAGIAGVRLLVPRALSVAATPEDNADVLTWFAAFCGRALRARTDDGVAAKDGEDDLATAPLRRLVRARSWGVSLLDELPGLAPLQARTAPALRAALNDAPRDGRAGVLAVIALQRLDADASVVDARMRALPAGAGAVARAAVDADDVDDALAKGFRALAAGGRFCMPACFGTVRATPPAVAIWSTSMRSALPRDVTTEREGRKRAPPTKRRVWKARPESENPLTHSFEKVHTAEEHKGGRKQTDARDELGDHGAALDEIDLDETVLSDDTAASVYRAGMPGGDVDAEDGGVLAGLCYDEWDERARAYLKGWCRLEVVRGAAKPVVGARLAERVARDERRAVEEVRAAVLAVQTGLRWRKRQADGDDVDVDAAVDRRCDLAAGHEGSPRVYVARRRSAPELAAGLLLDASLSTDAFVDDRRVLDVERDATAIVGLGVDGVVDEFFVGAFFSDTRARCSFVQLKQFDDAWSVGMARLGALAPAGHTRIGPALRHATTLLSTSTARRRVLFVLTDGRPADRDRYEGRHGEADLRQAVREAARARVEVVALSVDPKSAPALRTVFGHRATADLRRPADVARVVGDVLARRLAG